MKNAIKHEILLSVHIMVYCYPQSPRMQCIIVCERKHLKILKYEKNLFFVVCVDAIVIPFAFICACFMSPFLQLKLLFQRYLCFFFTMTIIL